MPDTQTSGGSKNSFGFLTRKLGPAPLWLWALLAVGAYYLYTKYKGGSSGSTAATGADAVDPATGVTYAQELSDAQDQITQLQAQINQQGQGQTAPTTINITQTDTDTEPGNQKVPPPTPPPPHEPCPFGFERDPKTGKCVKKTTTGKEKKIPNVAGNSAAQAISTIEANGFETHTNPYRDPSKAYVATGTTPSGQAPEGSTVVINVKETGKGTTTKTKARGKPRTPALSGTPGPVRTTKPKPATTPARRAA